MATTPLTDPLDPQTLLRRRVLAQQQGSVDPSLPEPSPSADLAPSADFAPAPTAPAPPAAPAPSTAPAAAPPPAPASYVPRSPSGAYYQGGGPYTSKSGQAFDLDAAGNAVTAFGASIPWDDLPDNFGHWGPTQNDNIASNPVPPAGVQSMNAGSSGGVSDWQARIRQMLLDRLKVAGSPLDLQDPGITAPMQAAQDQAQRAQDAERTALAERGYAEGTLRSNALTQGIQQSAERNATGLSSLRANLIGQQVDRKQRELDQLLQLATASGDAEAARQIQRELANLQATVQREGLGLDAAKYAAYLNSNAALAGLNG